MVLQALNWHKLFPRSRLTDRYYATGFDYSRAQPVDSIGTTAYIVRRSTWENAGMLDERFQLFVSDLAYNFMLRKKGYAVHYTPCAEVVHFGSQSVNQTPQSSLRELHNALIEFNEAYDYFGKSRASKLLVRFAVKARDYFKHADPPEFRQARDQGTGCASEGVGFGFVDSGFAASGHSDHNFSAHFASHPIESFFIIETIAKTIATTMVTTPFNLTAYRLPAWKRGMDLVLGGTLLVLSSPLFLLCWTAVRLTSPGPALHWSERVGQDNRVFGMPKFRTMRVNTPQVATHLMQQPARYLTPCRRLLAQDQPR